MSGRRRRLHVQSPQTMEDIERLGHGSFPDETPVYLSHHVFPANQSVASSLDLPLGLVTRPFIHSQQEPVQRSISMHAKDIDRCGNCGAYINAYCNVNTSRWYCSLCGHRNNFNKSHTRYKHIDHRYLPELLEVMNDFRAPIKEGTTTQPIPLSQRPLVHVFVVQEDMEVETLQMVVDSLESALGAVHPDMQIILISFSYHIAVYNLRGDSLIPSVQYVHLYSERDERTMEERLHEGIAINRELDEWAPLLPLHEMATFCGHAAPVGDSRSSFANALNALFESATSDSLLEEHRNRLLTLDAVIDALLDWVRGTPFVDSEKDGSSSAAKEMTPFDFSRLWRLLDAQSAATQGLVDGAVTSSNEYTAVQFHLFIDSTQTPRASFDINERIQRALSLCVSVSVWGVTTFDSHTLSLSDYTPFVRATGGALHRFSLSVCPQNDRVLCAEALRRTLASRCATRCRFKLRLAPLLHVIDKTPAGAFCTQNEAYVQSGVVSLPCAYEDASLAFQLRVDDAHTALAYARDLAAHFEHAHGDNAVALQFVFDYETIVSATPTQTQTETHTDVDISEDTACAEQWIDACSLLQHASSTLGIDSKNANQSTKSSKESDEEIPWEVLQSAIEARGSRVRRVAPWDSRDSLCVVRYVRVCTVAVPTTNRRNAVLKSCDLAVCAALLAKEALMAHSYARAYTNNTHTPSESTGERDPLTHRERETEQEREKACCVALLRRVQQGGRSEELLLNAITQLVRHRLAAHEAERALREVEREKDIHSHSHVHSHTLSYTHTDTETESDPATLVNLIFTHSTVRGVLLCLYTLLVRLMDGRDNTLAHTHAHAESAAQWNDDTECWTHALLRSDPYCAARMLSPQLTGLSVELSRCTESLPLRRDAMLSSGAALFLLDAGDELVLYRPLAGSQNNTQETTNGEDVSENEEETSEEKKRTRSSALVHPLLRWLLWRLYEHPLLPKLLVAEAGTASSAFFTRYFVEDATNTPIDLEDLKLLVLDIIQSLSN